MATKQEIEIQRKREVATAEEATRSARYYVPCTDIHETDQALSIAMEVPGVAKDGVEVTLEKDVLKVAGQVDFSNYEDLEPIYTEYEVGHFQRSFSLSNKIDQGAISARVENGVLHLDLPKTREATHGGSPFSRNRSASSEGFPTSHRRHPARQRRAGCCEDRVDVALGLRYPGNESIAGPTVPFRGRKGAAHRYCVPSRPGTIRRRPARACSNSEE